MIIKKDYQQDFQSTPIVIFKRRHSLCAEPRKIEYMRLANIYGWVYDTTTTTTTTLGDDHDEEENEEEDDVNDNDILVDFNTFDEK